MRPPKRSLFLLATAVAVAAIVALAGCAYPRVSLRDARLDRLQLTGLTIDVYLDVENPNQFALPLEQVDWSLRLFDTHVGAGTSRMNKTLPAQETTRVRMPISVKFRQSASVAQRIVDSRSIPWSLDGTATFRAPTGPIALDFDDGGRWNNPIMR